jgi:hypothetical protein
VKVLFALILITGCGGSSPSNPVADYARADCARLVDCGLIDKSDRAACEQREHEGPPPELAVDPALISGGRRAWDTAALASCLDARKKLDCGLWQAPPECANVIVGNVARGGACDGTDQCENSDTCAMSTSCAGTCQAPPGLGEACNPDCAPHLRCPTVQEPMPGICQTRPTAGQPCTAGSFGQCDDGLVCIAAADFASGACQAPGGAGDRCMIYISDIDLSAGVQQPRGACQAGLICDFTQAVPVCAAAKQAGEVCTSPLECVQGLQCTAFGVGLKRQGTVSSPFPEPGNCVAPTPRGGSCGTNAVCQFFDACVDGVCTRRPQIGDACTPGNGATGCVVGYCDPQSQRCQSRLASGSACDPGVDSCVLPMICDEKTRTCGYQPTCVSSN